MNRIIVLVGVCCLAVAGCGGPTGRHYGARYLAADLAKPSEPGNNQSFSYTHILSLEMLRTRIQPCFERARNDCLRVAALNCKLVSANINSGDDTSENQTDAMLVVQLPHDQIASFERSILSALPGEDAADVRVASRSTQAQNVQQEQVDVEHRLAQLADYRDRLTALARRPDVRVDDLIKIQNELSNVESQLEQLAIQKRDVGERISREQLTVSFGEHETVGDAFRPIVAVWRDSIATVAQSAADALRFLIQVIPWLPILAGGFFLASWLWRLVRRRKA